MSQHVIAVADRGQVVRAIPALELIEQTDQAIGIRLSQRDTEARGVLNQALHYAHRNGSSHGQQ